MAETPPGNIIDLSAYKLDKYGELTQFEKEANAERILRNRLAAPRDIIGRWLQSAVDQASRLYYLPGSFIIPPLDVVEGVEFIKSDLLQFPRRSSSPDPDGVA